MEKVPYSKYTKKLRLEAIRLVTEGGLSVGDASMQLSPPKSTLENWVRALKPGKPERIGATHPAPTDGEIELARVNLKLALVRMERDILKKAAAYFAKESLHARGDGADRWAIRGSKQHPGHTMHKCEGEIFPLPRIETFWGIHA